MYNEYITIKQMNIKPYIFGFFILLISVAACSKEESSTNPPEGETSISAQIGEEIWEGVDYESALNVIPGRGQFFELSAFSSKYKVDLSVLEFDQSTGTISEGIYEEDIFFSIFMSNEEGEFIVEYKPIEETTETPFNIHILASSNSRISGTFSGMVRRVSEEDEDYPEILLITNGIFNNLPFETHTVNIQ